MNEGSLRDDLLSIPGVEGAEVEGSPDKPAGLRIRIAEGADQRAVGGAIRRVLTSHGLGTDTKLPGEPDADTDDAADEAVGESDTLTEAAEITEGPAPELEEIAAPAAVAVEDAPGEPVDLDGDEQPAAVIDLTDHALDGDDVEAPPAVVDDADVGSDDAPADEAATETAEAADAPRLTPVATAPTDPAVARLASVAVEEGRDGIVVSVATTDGDRVRQAAGSTEGGVESAVVRATARLAMPHAPEATVVDIDDRRVEGVDIVMIVLDVDGDMHAGSAVVAAGRAFALGRATWAALTL